MQGAVDIPGVAMAEEGDEQLELFDKDTTG